MTKRAKREDLPHVAALVCRLWPGCSTEEVLADITGQYEAGEAFFLAYRGSEPVGFAEVSLRREYVEGSETSPVGYLEGIYVEENARRQGIAGNLLAACENWARENNAREFASDCQMDNEPSRQFHQACGFTEAARLICFIKPLK